MEATKRLMRSELLLRSRKFIMPTLALLIIFTLLVIGAVTCLGQASIDEFRSALSAEAGFSPDEWSAVERGEIVTKLLPGTDKREVAVCGIARVRGTPEVIAKVFTQSMAQQSSKSILAIGRFSNPPLLSDVETLSLEKRDIEDLKRCAEGKCEVKLSTAMIQRFHQEVNWTSPDYELQANRLFRQMLVDYVREYQTRGAAALLEYHDQSLPVSIAKEHQSLLERMAYINDFAPEFVNNVKNFPHSELSDFESSISWTKLRFGLKPVIIVTHTTTYKRSKPANQILSLSSQIFANHYFDSSLGLTAVVSFPKDAAASDSYLLYTNHSRADSLASSFSRVKRGLVEAESIEKLNALLLQAKANVEVACANQSGENRVSRRQRISDWLFRGTGQYAWFVVIALLIALSGHYLRRIREPHRSLAAKKQLRV